MGFNVVVLSGRLTADPEIRMGTNDTMIARYNLEEENKSLLEEIAERKKVIDDLEQKEQVLRDRFKKAISNFKEIMEHGYSEDDDEDEYESEWE